jgi:hypothetical protein
MSAPTLTMAWQRNKDCGLRSSYKMKQQVVYAKHAEPACMQMSALASRCFTSAVIPIQCVLGLLLPVTHVPCYCKHTRCRVAVCMRASDVYMQPLVHSMT